MSRISRLICVLLAAAIVLALPFLLPSGAMRYEHKLRLDEQFEDGGTLLVQLLLPGARAETLPTLPIDFSPGPTPNPALFGPEGYVDESITLRLETREEEGVVWRIAWVDIKHPSQLRTALAGQPGSNRVAMISSMAKKHQAIIAINANFLTNAPDKTSYEYRMGEKIRARFNRTKDLLIVDENADFHLFVQSQKEEVEAFLGQGHQIINAFTFGPALVKDSIALALDDNYGYNPHGREPRLAIGQMGPLSYVLVLAEGRTAASQGVTHIELADYMYMLGCHQAFNLDGGNSGTMVYNGGYYQQKDSGSERAQSDMIYFATLVDPATWQ